MGCYLSCIRDCFQLQSRQAATIDGFLWDGHSVPDIRRVDAGQGAGLHHGIRMPEANLHCMEKLTGQLQEAKTGLGQPYGHVSSFKMILLRKGNTSL